MHSSDRKLVASVKGTGTRLERLQEARHERRVANGTAAKPRPTCKCPAYPWPHRPKGGLCRWPDPPEVQFQRKAGRKPPFWARHERGIRRRLIKKYDLHPIRDRAKIHRFLPKLYVAWCRRGFS